MFSLSRSISSLPDKLFVVATRTTVLHEIRGKSLARWNKFELQEEKEIERERERGRKIKQKESRRKGGGKNMERGKVAVGADKVGEK